MHRENINHTEARMLRLLPYGSMTLAEIADALDAEFSWIYKCAAHLEAMGLLACTVRGRRTMMRLPETPLGNALSVLLVEEPAMNLHALLGGKALSVLPLLLPPGCSSGELAARAGTSVRTIQSLIRRWRGMGLAIRQGKAWVLSPRHPLAEALAREYARSRNIARAKESFPDGVMVWQDRDEYMVSTEKESGSPAAGPTRLSELGYDIVSRNLYYMSREVSEAEALVQTLMLNPLDPRPPEYIRHAIRNGRVKKTEIGKYSDRYGVGTCSGKNS